MEREARSIPHWDTRGPGELHLIDRESDLLRSSDDAGWGPAAMVAMTAKLFSISGDGTTEISSQGLPASMMAWAFSNAACALSAAAAAASSTDRERRSIFRSAESATMIPMYPRRTRTKLAPR